MKKVPSELERACRLRNNPTGTRTSLPGHVSHTFTPRSAVDEDNLVSCAGLVPVMALARQAGLSQLSDKKIRISRRGGSSPGWPTLPRKLATLIASADYIDDVDLVRAGRMRSFVAQVYAPSTVGHCCVSSSLAMLANSTPCLPNF